MSRTFACFSTTYKASAPVVVVHSAQLDRKLMAARVAVAHEVLGAGIDILLPQLGAIAEGRRHGLVEDLDSIERIRKSRVPGRTPGTPRLRSHR